MESKLISTKLGLTVRETHQGEELRGVKLRIDQHGAPIRQEAMPSLLHAAPFGAPRGALKSQNTRRTQKFIAHLSQYHAVASCLASKPTYGTCSLARASRKRTFTYRYRLKIRFFVFTSEYNLNVF